MAHRIRTAGQDDTALLAALIVEQPLFQRYGCRREGIRKGLRAAIETGDLVLLVQQPDGPVGAAWFQPSAAFGRGAYLRLIAVSAGMEGEGIGSALLREGERRLAASGTHSLFVMVSGFNNAAQRFYSCHGFEQVGAIPGFVLPDVTELIFWKRLR